MKRFGGRRRRGGGGIIGVILVLGAIGVLFWNEGRSAHRLDALTEGRATVTSAASERVDPALDGRLVHVSGPAAALESVGDPVFRIRVTGLRLDRLAEMYQWQERRRSRDGHTTYSYDRVWSDRLIDSRSFHEGGHENPSDMAYRSQQWPAPVRLGDFRLDGALIGELAADQAVAVDPVALRRNLGPFSADGEWLYSGAPGQPRVGDLRVRFVMVPEQTVSVIALQTAGRLVPYIAENGEVLALIEPGGLSAAALFALAEERNAVRTWAIRAGAAFGMFLGFALAMASLTRWLPVFRGLATGAAVTVSALLAGSLSLFTMAVGWLVYRPVMAVGLLAAGVILAVGLPMVLRRTRNATPGLAMPPPPPPQPSSNPSLR